MIGTKERETFHTPGHRMAHDEKLRSPLSIQKYLAIGKRHAKNKRAKHSRQVNQKVQRKGH